MENIGIETTQNVNIDYKIASLGDRVVAQIIDFLILFGYAFAMMFLLIYINQAFYNSSLYFPTAYFVILYLPFFLYDFIFEVFLNGQSIGKKVMKIRVVKIDGSQPGLGSYFLRWILKPIDVFLTQGSVAFITILINGKGQRLGDLAANTTVIKLKQDVKLEEILLPNVEGTYDVIYPQVSLLNDNDIQIIKDVLNHKMNSDIYTYQNLVDKAKIGIARKMGIEAEANGLKFLNTVIKDYTYLNSH
jgi:uncharacterized RDD family membrane protein YckC